MSSPFNGERNLSVGDLSNNRMEKFEIEFLMSFHLSFVKE